MIWCIVATIYAIGFLGTSARAAYVHLESPLLVGLVWPLVIPMAAWLTWCEYWSTKKYTRKLQGRGR